MKELDERGVPGTFVVTTEFREAAESQANALGFEPAIVWVDHPIQNRTPAELEALADRAVDSILETITERAGDRA